MEELIEIKGTLVKIIKKDKLEIGDKVIINRRSLFIQGQPYRYSIGEVTDVSFPCWHNVGPCPGCLGGGHLVAVAWGESKKIDEEKIGYCWGYRTYYGLLPVQICISRKEKCLEIL